MWLECGWPHSVVLLQAETKIFRQVPNEGATRFQAVRNRQPQLPTQSPNREKATTETTWPQHGHFRRSFTIHLIELGRG